MQTATSVGRVSNVTGIISIAAVFHYISIPWVTGLFPLLFQCTGLLTLQRTLPAAFDGLFMYNQTCHCLSVVRVEDKVRLWEPFSRIQNGSCSSSVIYLWGSVRKKCSLMGKKWRPKPSIHQKVSCCRIMYNFSFLLRARVKQNPNSFGQELLA